MNGHNILFIVNDSSVLGIFSLIPKQVKIIRFFCDLWEAELSHFHDWMTGRYPCSCKLSRRSSLDHVDCVGYLGKHFTSYMVECPYIYIQVWGFYLQSGGTWGMSFLKSCGSEWIFCLTSQLTIFQSYMWRHIDVQAEWRRSWTYGRASNAIDIS